MANRRTTTMQSHTGGGIRASFLKVILLGDGMVGKTSLMNRFVTNKYSETLLRTIGVEFLNKDLIVNGQTYTLQIWDTAGWILFDVIIYLSCLLQPHNSSKVIGNVFYMASNGD